MRIRGLIAVTLIVVLVGVAVRQRDARAQAYAYSVNAWNPMGMTWSTPNLLSSVKGILSNPVWYNGATWVVSVLAPAAVATIVQIGITAGLAVGGAAAAAAITYATVKGLEYVTGTSPPQFQTPAVPGVPGARGAMGHPLRVDEGDYDSGTLAASACQSANNGVACPNSGQWIVYATGWGSDWYFVNRVSGGYYHMYSYSTAVGTPAVPIDIPALTALIAADVVSEDSQVRAAAQDLAISVATAIAPGWSDWADGVSGLPGTMTLSQAQSIQGALAGGITEADRVVIASKDTVANGTGGTQPLTVAQTAEAVREGVTASATDGMEEVDNLASEGDPEVPEEDSLKGKLDTFWSALQSLPVVGLLTGLGITASGGSPQIVMTVPGMFGSGAHNVTLNFDQDQILGINYGTVLATLGQLTLALVGIRWTIYLFRSGG